MPVYGMGDSKPSRLLLLIDGLPDRPHPALEGKTPLQAADLPVFDRLAAEGCSGLADVTVRESTITTVHGTLAVFGYAPEKLQIARGVIEALGCELRLEDTDVALRGNWATFDRRGLLRDRRAGRIREGSEELARELKKIRFEEENTVEVHPSTEHRLVLLLRGPDLSEHINGSDPGDSHPSGIPPRIPQPLDNQDPLARKTARLLHQFEQEAHRLLDRHPLNLERTKIGLLPANAIISREPGKQTNLKTVTSRNRTVQATIISAEKTIHGIARILGFDFYHQPEMTANLDTDLAAKFACAGDFLHSQEVVMLHIKGADIAAHNRDPLAKRDFLQRIDFELGEFVDRYSGDLLITITSDHGTSSLTGVHLHDPVPVLHWGKGVQPDAVMVFDETQFKEGGLGRFALSELWEQITGAAGGGG